jgi:hypothetical protein
MRLTIGSSSSPLPERRAARAKVVAVLLYLLENRNRLRIRQVLRLMGQHADAPLTPREICERTASAAVSTAPSRPSPLNTYWGCVPPTPPRSGTTRLRNTGDTTKAKAAYQDFLALWEGADPDTPMLQQAKAEYAKLL